MSRSSSICAFTLIEVLVYLSLFTLLMTGCIASMIQLRSGTERIEAGARLMNTGLYILEQAGYAIERTGSTTVPAANGLSSWDMSTGEDGGRRIGFLLTIRTKSGNPITARFSGMFFPLNP